MHYSGCLWRNYRDPEYEFEEDYRQRMQNETKEIFLKNEREEMGFLEAFVEYPAKDYQEDQKNEDRKWKKENRL